MTGGAGAPGSARSAAAAIGRFVDRLRLLLLAAALATAAARCAALAALAATLNVLVAERPPFSPWLGFAVALAGSAGVGAGLLLAALRVRRPSRAAAARGIERRLPGARNDVESSLELAPLLDAAGDPGVSRPLLGALLADTASALAGAAPRRFVPLRPLREGLLLLGATLLPLAALALFGAGVPSSALRGVIDPRVYWPLGRYQLAVEPGDARVARGGELSVRVRVASGRPAAVRLQVEAAPGAASDLAPARAADGTWSWRFAPVAGAFRYRAVAGAAASPWYRVSVVDPPVAGDFEVLYSYPAYSGLPPRRVAGGGALEGLRGTTAAVEFSSTRPLARAVLAAGDSRVVAESVGERRHRGSVYLDTARSWRLELTDAEGFAGLGEYPVRYLPDAPPTVELLEPTGTLESEPEASIALRWRAADDYGLSGLALVARRDAGERRQPLPPGPSPRSAGGEAIVELGEIGARPGEVVTLVVEAADNDAIGGPKVSRSAPLVIAIADPRVRREEVRETLERLADDLLQLLAEELELQEEYRELEGKAAEEWERFPWQRAEEAAGRQQSARDAAARAGRRAEALARALERGASEGEATRYQAELLQRGLAELGDRQLEPMRELAAGLKAGESTAEETQAKSGHLARQAEEAARAAEQLALLADAMQRERGMAEVGREAQELASAEERLLDGLERLAPGDRKAAAEVLRQIDEIERGLREIAEALARESKELPEEFLNSDALKGLDVGEILSELDRIREMVARGDLEGARRAAKALAGKLADLRNRLQQAGEEFEEKTARGLDRLRGNALPELQRLIAEERSLLARTEAIARAAGPRLEQALRAAAGGGEPGEPPTEAAVLTPDERSRALALAREQEALRARAERVAAEIAALRAALPFLPAELGQAVAAAGGHMGEARDRLAESLPGPAVDPERRALAELQKASEGAQRALEEMEGMQGLRRGSGGGAIGLGRPGGQPRAGQGADPSRGRRSGGRRGTDVRNFVIPGRQDHRVPQIFREEILKSLREGYPPQYEGRIKDYYQRITE